MTIVQIHFLRSILFVFFAISFGAIPAVSQELPDAAPPVSSGDSGNTPQDTTPTPVPTPAPELQEFTQTYNMESMYGIRSTAAPFKKEFNVGMNKKEEIISFSWENYNSPVINPKGGGPITPPRRGYRVVFPSVATQDAGLSVYDQPNDANSENMESLLMFFPRKYIPTFKLDEDEKNVIISLPTGEKFSVNAETKEISGGVLEEKGSIDLDPNPSTRFFPRLAYYGKGVLLRADRRGGLPQNARLPVSITKGMLTCEAKASELWKREKAGDEFGPRFIYASDAEFDSFLKTKCGFSLFD